MSKVRFITGVGSGPGTADAEAGDRVVAIGENVGKVRNALRDVAIATLLAASCAAYAQEAPIKVTITDGKTTAQFNVGEWRCLLVDDEIRCMPVGK